MSRISRTGATAPHGPACLLVLLAVAALQVSGCGGEPAPRRDAPTEGPGREETILATAGERAGESIYRRENCARCHTLFDRPAADGRLLPPSPATEAALLESRVGPDLGLEGHRHSDEWHYAHLYAPEAVVPGSRMPASRHLFRPLGGLPAPTSEARDLVAYLQAIGRGRRDIWAEWRGREVEVPVPPEVDEALAGHGRELYRRNCASCHGEGGDGRGGAAAFFTIAPRDFTVAPGGRTPADADLYRTITLGSGTGAAMPSFYWLDERDRWALVLAVKQFSPTLRAPGLSSEARDEADRLPSGDGQPDEKRREAGRALWNDLGCGACHGDTGAGVQGSGPDLTHACGLRAGASPEAIDRSIRRGVGTAMPSYADAMTDANSRRLLVDHVRGLFAGATTSRRTPDRP